MSPTSSIALAAALVLLAAAVVALAVRRHRGGRHRAPEPMGAVLAARTGVGAVAVGSVASSVLVLVGHGASTGTTVQAAEASRSGSAPSDAGRSGPALDRTPAAPAVPEHGYVVVPPPRAPLDDRARSDVVGHHATRTTSPPHVSRHRGTSRPTTPRPPSRHRSPEHWSPQHRGVADRPGVTDGPARHRAVERDARCDENRDADRGEDRGGE